MSVGMIAFWGLIAWAIVALVRGGSASRKDSVTRPEAVLSARLARGDISADEYVRARQLIDDDPARTDPDKSVEVM